MVSHDAVEAFGNPIFVSNHDDRLAQYQKLVAAAKAEGSLFISQLSHVGRQGGKHLNPSPVSASDVQLKIKWGGNEFAKPRALQVNEIKGIVNDFADSAYWCWKAGYDGVQVSYSPSYIFYLFFGGMLLDIMSRRWDVANSERRDLSSSMHFMEGICMPKGDSASRPTTYTSVCSRIFGTMTQIGKKICGY